MKKEEITVTVNVGEHSFNDGTNETNQIRFFEGFVHGTASTKKVFTMKIFYTKYLIQMKTFPLL